MWSAWPAAWRTCCVAEGAVVDSHRNDTARELPRGLLIHVAGLPGERRSMAELHRIVTASEDDVADTLPSEPLAEGAVSSTEWSSKEGGHETEGD